MLADSNLKALLTPLKITEIRLQAGQQNPLSVKRLSMLTHI